MNTQLLQSLGMLPPGGDAVTPKVNPPLQGVLPPAMQALMGMQEPAMNPAMNPAAIAAGAPVPGADSVGGAAMPINVADILAQKTASPVDASLPAGQAVIPAPRPEGSMAGEGGLMDLLQSPQGYMALLSMAAPLLSGKGAGEAIQAGLGTYQGYEDKKEKAKQRKFENQLLLDNKEMKKKGMELDAETLEWRQKDADATRQLRADMANMDKETRLEVAKLKRENDKALAEAKVALETGTVDPKLWAQAVRTAEATAPQIPDGMGGSMPGPVSINEVYHQYNSMAPADRQSYRTADTAAFNEIQKKLGELDGNQAEQEALVDKFYMVYGEKAIPALSARLKSAQAKAGKEKSGATTKTPPTKTPPPSLSKPITTPPPHMMGQQGQGLSPLLQMLQGQ